MLCVCHAKLPFCQILSAINGNLVALCSYSGTDILMPDGPQLPPVLGQQPVCPCLGFGELEIYFKNIEIFNSYLHYKDNQLMLYGGSRCL
jgi:hypothetical protein